ncbi:MAG: hypothetical protein U9N53_02005, partial [Bacteroidota bacterium]|nr:hypothetical protein [Bacteroidota bacterium]
MFKKAKIKGPMGRIYPPVLLIIYVLGVAEFLILDWPLYTNLLAGVFFIAMGIIQMKRYHLL